MSYSSEEDYVSKEVCITLPPRVNSLGIKKHPEIKAPNYNIMDYSMPRFEVQLVMIFAITQASHFVLKRFGFPMFSSQVLAGLILFQVLDKMKMDTEESIQVLSTIGTIGYAFFLFQAGVKIDLTMVRRAGKKALYIGFLSVFTPILSGLAVIKIFIHNHRDQHAAFLLTTTTCIVTSFPVINCLLNEMKILNSELGRLGQSAALISDLLSLVLVIGTVLGIIAVEQSFEAILPSIEWMVAFIAITAFILRPAMSWVVRHTPEGRPVKDIYVYAVICVFMVVVSLDRWVHQFILLGPYILGLAVPDGPPLGSVLVDKFDCMVSGILLPLFVAACSMRIDLLGISLVNTQARTSIVVLVASFLAKFGAVLVPSLCSKMPMKDSCALALIMCSKGIIEMATFCLFSDNMIINLQTSCLMARTIIFIGTIVPVLVNLLYDPSRKYAGYERRNIMHSQPKSELQILACIHVPNNVTAVINLLDASCPTGDSPIAVNVLHLIKLSGQAAPVFISHETRKQNLTNHSYSENVILSFTKFEANNWGAVLVNAFTAISPPSLMHEDICTLALDKFASLIILPFHRRWYIDGSIESEDHSIRTLNYRVLERAPCSVGILIDRGNKRHPISTDLSSDSSYNIAMIFLGGHDDQEGLTYAKRMAQDTRSNLTVVRFIAPSERGRTDWASMIDSEVLMDVKNNRFIRYIEEEANDGPETALSVRSMLNEYDLFIVGRRYNIESPLTSGLKEWSEFPELGIIGDIFASKDLDGKCSILVVQQQQTTSHDLPVHN